MKTSILRRASAGLAGSLVLAACAHHSQTGPAPVSPDDLYRRGMEASAAGKHSRAATLLTQFADAAAGDPRVPAALVTVGREHVANHEYITAAADFLRVVNDYPGDPAVRDARMGMCDAYTHLSPKPQLDPEYTETAITYCQSVAAIYPNTPQGVEASRRVDRMEEKLALKAYQNGIFYFRRKAYDAAAIYFNEALANFPRTGVAPMALMRLYEGYGALGYKEEQEATRERLLRDYPQSPEARALPAAAPPSAPVRAPPPAPAAAPAAG
ncbi:MAG TPA: outer membrane protein assembly factor BamD [Longimicrobiaceae bacterium]|jgi:outer membrane protein assembly factor BamD|nr:outer membrane protein assembly factor BamD [Longimicrobiaceae bacterium]